MSATDRHSRYPGIRSFQKDESALFFGRSKEIRELYSLIKVERLVVLFSKSGIGKTSLLNAGVLPKLAEEDFINLPLRFQDTTIDPISILKKQLDLQLKELELDSLVERQLQKWCGERRPSDWEYLKACEIVLAYLPAELVLVLDQFEEFFLHTTSAQEPFIELLAQIAFSRVPIEQRKWAEGKDALSSREEQWLEPLNFKLVLAIRSDRLSLLEYLSTAIPAILDSRYQLHPLNKGQATEAILMPAQSSALNFQSASFQYREDALEEIIKNLSNDKGEIESFQLQIICRHLEDLVSLKGIPEVLPKHIGGAKGVAEILNGYYETRINALGDQKAVQLAREFIEEGLIVEGSRVGLAEAIVLTRYKISPALLAKIEASRIIKAEDTHLGKAYEIAHDTLVEPILKSFRERQLVEKQAAATAERQQLAKEAIAQRQKAEEEAKKRQRSNTVAIIALVFAIGAIGLGITSYLFYTSAKENAISLKKINEDLEAKDEELLDSIATLRKTRKELNKQIDAFKASEATRLRAEFKNKKRAARRIIAGNICVEEELKRMEEIAKIFPENERYQKDIKYIRTLAKTQEEISGSPCH